MISLGGIVIVNVLSYTSFSYSCDFYDDSTCDIRTSPLSIVMIIIGAFLAIASISFFIVIQCTISGLRGGRFNINQVNNNNQNSILQPFNVAYTNNNRQFNF